MRIYKVKEVTNDILNAFEKLIPQLSNTTPPSKSDLEEIVNSQNTILFIAEEEEVVGVLTLVLNRIPTGQKVWIEDVVVDNRARGKGVGKKLTQHAINYAIERGLKQINLTSSPGRIAANKLYQTLGFVKRETNVYRLTL